MWFRSLLLKIETGQELTKSQIKRLAKKLMLAPSFLRMTAYVLFSLFAALLLFVGYDGGKEPLSAELSYILAAVLIVLMILMLVIPRLFRIKKYLNAVEKFFETKFASYDDFDLYYIDQHVNPHIRLLNTPKIYLLTDGYHFLFMADPFINTEFKMPKYLANNKKPSYLRVINSNVDKDSKIIVRLEDVEHFYISSSNLPKIEPIKETKTSKYIKYFFDQESKYNEKSIVVLKMQGGLILRLSHEIYPVLVDLMAHKERVYELWKCF